MPNLLTKQAYIDGVLSGDRVVLSRAITLVESIHPEHEDMAQQVLAACLPHSGKSIRIGITGVPGVGKSTFIEALGNAIISQQNKKLAVLAIDPSSTASRGSILGDKTRMSTLSNNPNAYIRPTSSSGKLGGVAQRTREAIILCEAAGFDTIFVETVGVGQSETAVYQMVDFFLLLMLAGAGDELQGIKRGIMEMADAIVINKADGDNINKAKLAVLQYKQAAHLFVAKPSGWTPTVSACSALSNSGINTIWDNIEIFEKAARENGFFDTNRKNQNKYWFHECINQLLLTRFYQTVAVKNQLTQIETKVVLGEITPQTAAKTLIGLL